MPFFFAPIRFVGAAHGANGSRFRLRQFVLRCGRPRNIGTTQRSIRVRTRSDSGPTPMHAIDSRFTPPLRKENFFSTYLRKTLHIP